MGIGVAIADGKKSDLIILPKSWNGHDLAKLFKSELYPSLRWSNRLGHQSRLLIDNDGRHQQHVWIDYMTSDQLRPIRPFPANSPDLNPIENVFSWMKWPVELDQPSTSAQLEASIRRAWDGYPIEATENLMQSMPGRLEEVLRVKGRRIAY